MLQSGNLVLSVLLHFFISETTSKKRTNTHHLCAYPEGWFIQERQDRSLRFTTWDIFESQVNNHARAKCVNLVNSGNVEYMVTVCITMYKSWLISFKNTRVFSITEHVYAAHKKYSSMAILRTLPSQIF